MSGFGTAAGFVFSFLIIASIMGYSFISLSTNMQESVNYLKENEKMIRDSKIEYEFSSIYYESDHLKIIVENTGPFGISLQKEDSFSCIDVYVNGNFISKDKFSTYMINPTGNYYYLNPGEEVVLDVHIGTLDNSVDNEIKVVSCEGIKKEYLVESNLFNWADFQYKKRNGFTVVNGGGSNLLDNYFLVELTSSNFDFTKSSEDEILFYLPVDENQVLDLNFDNYAQDIEDHSKYNNIVTLGAANTVGVDDPVKVEGIFFDALNFDGNNDYLNIAADSSLQIDKSITVSSWIKWGGVGDAHQPIFYNGLSGNQLYIINDGLADDSKIGFNLSIGGTPQKVVSVNTLDNTWHHVAATYNGSVMKVYLDGQLEDESLISGDISTSFSLNYVGKDNLGNYFNGSVDDFKLFNIALNDSEIEQLFLNKLNVIELNHTVDSWDVVNSVANISVKIPYIRSLENISFELYYYPGGVYYESNITSTPSGASVPSKIADLTGSKGNGIVDLFWSAPNDGGSSITKYVVEYGTVSSGLFNYTYIDDAIANTTITGLTNDIGWQFRVYAVNAEGNGPASDPITLIPTGTYWMTLDTTTNLGLDGTANQGTTPVALAQMLYGNESPSVSACIQGGGGAKSNTIYAQEYTPVFTSQIEIEQNVTGNVVVYSNGGVINTWRAILYEYNDVTGNVATLGTAQNSLTTGTPQNLSLSFNNTAFNVSAGNRLKVVVDVTSGNDKPLLCYGQGTQSYFSFNRN